MSYLGPTLQCFFAERLVRERRASPFTIGAYRDTFRLLIEFAHERTGKAPSRLDLADLDAPLIGAFLEHLERDRQNSIRTRNVRLAAIHSFFRYAAFKHPEHAADIQRVLAIPSKRFERALIAFLDHRELMALLSAPDRTTWTGRGTMLCCFLRSRPACASRNSRAWSSAISISALVHTSEPTARAAKNASLRLPARPSARSGSGSGNAAAGLLTRCFPPVLADDSARTRSSCSSATMRPQLSPPAPPSVARRSLPTCFATRAPCKCCTAA